MKALDEKWEQKREEIFMSVLSGQARFDGMCLSCSRHPAAIKCEGCPDRKHLCYICDNLVHSRNPFHDREIWDSNCYVPIQTNECLDPEGHAFLKSML